MTTVINRLDSWVVPGVCPECEQPVTTVLFVICARCGLAWQGYEFLSDWIHRINADTRALWDMERATA